MHRKKRRIPKSMVIGCAFLLPSILLYVIFMVYPLLRTFYLSLTSWTGFGDAAYIGFGNFTVMLQDTMFRKALMNTLYFAVVSGILSVLVGIMMAWLNLFLRRMEGQVTRTILFVPNMIAPTITGLLFMFIFTEDIGLLNNILKAVGLQNLATAWLVNSGTVKQSVVAAQIWRQFGLTLILCFAGFQGIPAGLIESAKIDGAGTWKIFTRIMLPLIKPQIELASMFTLLGGLKIYDSVVSLTGGGPARQTVVLPMYIIENAFTYSKFGYASAMCVAFIFIVLLFIILMRFVFRGENYEY